MLPLRLGRWTVHAVETGYFALDGGSMFGSVPRALWSRLQSPDDRHRIRLAARCLLVEGEGRRVLVDDGVGDKFPPRLADIYGVEPAPTLETSLAALGFGVDDVTDVVLTHLHFDHAGGSTRRDGDRLVPRLPRARYHIQLRNLENARDPNPRERASYLAENFEPLAEAGVLEVWEGPRAPWPGFEVFTFDGHTRGQQGVRVSGPEGTVYFVADLIPTSSHVRIPYVMGYDIAAIETMREKAELLDRAAAEGAWILLEHDPVVALARPARDGDDFGWAERVDAVAAGVAGARPAPAGGGR
jgi:glyoxylase-like metal-dependent hydrolase (beta-lactamase superfamily II)